MSNVATILRAAADRIERDGWCQGGPGRDGDRCCIMVAAGLEFDTLRITKRDERFAMWDRIRAALIGHVRPRGQSMAGWNDSPGRTVDEVLAALRGAADAVEQGGEL